jgi:hyperosmotically inducible protein
MTRPCSSGLILAGILASLLLIAAPIYSAHAAYVSDAAITAEIKAKFLVEKSLDSLDLKVATTKGIVTLRGQVQRQAQADLAEKVARKVKGVRGVKNRVSVMP